MVSVVSQCNELSDIRKRGSVVQLDLIGDRKISRELFGVSLMLAHQVIESTEVAYVVFKVPWRVRGEVYLSAGAERWQVAEVCGEPLT